MARREPPEKGALARPSTRSSTAATGAVRSAAAQNAKNFQKTMSGMAPEKLLTLYSGQMDLDAHQVLSLGRQFNEICCTPTPH
jgi:hypothetical protein